MFDNRRWLVIPASAVDSLNFGTVYEDGPQSLRYSLDGSKTFVKYDITEVKETHTVEFPNPETGETMQEVIQAGIYGRPVIYNEGYPEYTHAEILELLAGPEWTFNEQI